MLDNPEGEVDGDPLVPEEVDVLPPRPGLEKVPEPALDPHGGAAAERGRPAAAVLGRCRWGEGEKGDFLGWARPI